MDIKIMALTEVVFLLNLDTGKVAPRDEQNNTWP